MKLVAHSDNREVLQVGREQANRRVVWKLRADAALSLHCCTRVGFRLAVPLPAGTESPHRHRTSHIYPGCFHGRSAKLRRHGRFLLPHKDEPCMGCRVSSIDAEVGLLEDCPGAKPRLRLPENVVDTFLNAEISRD